MEVMQKDLAVKDKEREVKKKEEAVKEKERFVLEKEKAIELAKKNETTNSDFEASYKLYKSYIQNLKRGNKNLDIFKIEADQKHNKNEKNRMHPDKLTLNSGEKKIDQVKKHQDASVSITTESVENLDSDIEVNYKKNQQQRKYSKDSELKQLNDAISLIFKDSENNNHAEEAEKNEETALFNAEDYDENKMHSELKEDKGITSYEQETVNNQSNEAEEVNKEPYEINENIQSKEELNVAQDANHIAAYHRPIMLVPAGFSFFTTKAPETITTTQIQKSRHRHHRIRKTTKTPFLATATTTNSSNKLVNLKAMSVTLQNSTLKLVMVNTTSKL